VCNRTIVLDIGKKVWQQAQVAKLLEVVKKYLTLLKGKTQAKKTVWEKISKELGEDFSAMECDQKWRNLKESYKNFELNKKKTGRGRAAVPAFYAELHDLLFDDHTVQPVALRDSQASPSAEGHSLQNHKCHRVLSKPQKCQRHHRVRQQRNSARFETA